MNTSHNTLEDSAVAIKEQALRDADDNNILITPEGKDGLYFMLDGNPHRVQIEEHFIHSHGYRRARSDGLKYRLANKHDNRYLTHPNSVIKKIVKLQEAVEAAAAQTAIKNNRRERAVAKAKEMYPNSEVSFNTTRQLVVVTTSKGVVMFTLDFRVYDVKQALTPDEIAESILGTPV